MKNNFFKALFLIACCVGLTFWFLKKVNESTVELEEKLFKADEADIVTKNPNPTTTPSITSDSTLKAAKLMGPSREMMNKISVRFTAGDYRTALELADQASSNDTFSPEFQRWLRDQMHAILVSAGWLELKLNSCNEAIRILLRADAIKHTPETVKGLAFCFFKTRSMMEAEQYLSFYLEQNSNDQEFRLMYADLLESQQRFEDAYFQLQKLSDETKEKVKKRISSMLEKSKEGAKQSTISTQNIQLTYRTTEHEELVQVILETLEDAINEFIDKYQFQPLKDPVEVLIYSTQNFGNIVQDGPKWATGIFDGRLRIPIGVEYLNGEKIEVLKRILRHELSHAMLARMTNLKPLPPWYAEGVAQKLECKETCRRNVFPATPGKFLSAQEFEESYIALQAAKAELCYRQSLYLILTLLNDESFDGEDSLIKTIRNISATSNLTSDGILAPLNLKFSELRERASNLWDKRVKME